MELSPGTTVFHRIGTDVVRIPRIQALHERYGNQFLNRVYTAFEQQYCLTSARHLHSRLAGRWAAKEAVTKALGTGWRGIGYREIEVVRKPSGEPTVCLHGRAALRVAPYGQLEWQLSFSHDGDYAVATVLLVGTLS